jgi:type II secretory pathway component GspD/PulD (secretin)
MLLVVCGTLVLADASQHEKNVQEVAKLSVQPAPITVEFPDALLGDVLNMVSQVSGVDIRVGDDVAKKKVKISIKEKPVQDALVQIADDTKLVYRVEGKKVLHVTSAQ